MSNNEELSRRIEKLDDAFTQHLQEGASRNVYIENLSESVERIDHAVYGNGKEGLVTLYARMDERLASIEECLTGLPDFVAKAVDEAVTRSTMPRQKIEKKEKPSSSADKVWMWFVERVLPYFVTGAFSLVILALWELLKVKLHTP